MCVQLKEVPRLSTYRIIYPRIRDCMCITYKTPTSDCFPCEIEFKICVPQNCLFYKIIENKFMNESSFRHCMKHEKLCEGFRSKDHHRTITTVDCRAIRQWNRILNRRRRRRSAGDFVSGVESYQRVASFTKWRHPVLLCKSDVICAKVSRDFQLFKC